MNFTIVKTRTTPQAEFQDGRLTIKGKSVPFDSTDCYDTICDRLQKYAENPKKETQVDFDLSAMNAATKRSIVDTFTLLEEINRSKSRVEINWFYQEDNEDIMEFGELCQSSFELAVSLIKSV